MTTTPKTVRVRVDQDLLRTYRELSSKGCNATILAAVATKLADSVEELQQWELQDTLESSWQGRFE